MSTTDSTPAAPEQTADPLWDEDRAPRRPLRAGMSEMMRYWWRQLTSMRTALVLLFLLALASVPGSLLPQRSLSQTEVREYLTENPTLGPLLSRLGFFDVFSSPWYAAIYLLLFVSLIGCLLPRIRVYLRALRTQPPAAPRRLERLPSYATGPAQERDRDQVLDEAEALLRARHWRVNRGVDSLGAEKGYLQEAGNLVFHISLLVLLIALALGRLNGYEGSRIAMEGEGFCNVPMSYDSFGRGAFVDGTDMTGLCVDLKSFETEYEPNLTPKRFLTDIQYTRSLDGPEADARIEINDPLRVDGVRVYVTGHGYAPVFTITTPDGASRVVSAPFLPTDQANLGSEGALKVDTGDAENQIAIEGFLAPTSHDPGNGIITSVDPRLLNPQIAIFVYRGYTGLDTGMPQSVYTLDEEVKAAGLLTKVASVNLKPGESTQLPDGTLVQFDTVIEWAAFQVSHDPGQIWVLGASVLMLVALMMTLFLRRRRLWVRYTGDSIQVAGLPHSGEAAFADEFEDLSTRILDRSQSVNEED